MTNEQKIHDNHTRAECLRLARDAIQNPTPAAVLVAAQAFYEFVMANSDKGAAK